MAEPPSGGGGDADRDGQDREALHVALPVANLDASPFGVLRVVQGRSLGVEPVAQGLGQVLGDVRVHDHHEVVASDVSDEAGRSDHLVDGLRDQAGQGLDGAVSAHEPVVVVVGLEVVEVRV